MSQRRLRDEADPGPYALTGVPLSSSPPRIGINVLGYGSFRTTYSIRHYMPLISCFRPEDYIISTCTYSCVYNYSFAMYTFATCQDLLSCFRNITRVLIRAYARFLPRNVISLLMRHRNEGQEYNM